MLNGLMDGNDKCLKLQEEFLISCMREFSTSNKLCLELAAGGPLQLFQRILIKYMHTVDINDISREQMKSTYDIEEKIKTASNHIGKIGDRF